MYINIQCLEVICVCVCAHAKCKLYIFYPYIGLWMIMVWKLPFWRKLGKCCICSLFMYCNLHEKLLFYKPYSYLIHIGFILITTKINLCNYHCFIKITSTRNHLCFTQTSCKQDENGGVYVYNSISSNF